MTKVFLTLEECKHQGLEYFEYRKGVYRYESEDDSWTLIQFGVILVSDVEYVEWYNKNTYRYESEDDSWTLVEDGKVLISNDYCVVWFKKGTYKYAHEDDSWTLVVDGKELISDADSIEWCGKGTYVVETNDACILIQYGVNHNVLGVNKFDDGVYSYIKDNKVSLIEYGVELISDVDWVDWYEKGVYKFEKEDDCTCTLVKDGKVLISYIGDISDIEWCGNNTYKYRNDDDNWIHVKVGK